MTQTLTMTVGTSNNSSFIDQLTQTQLTVDQVTKVEAAIMANHSAIRLLFFLSIIQTVFLVFCVSAIMAWLSISSHSASSLNLSSAGEGGGDGGGAGGLNRAPGQTLAKMKSFGHQVLSHSQS